MTDAGCYSFTLRWLRSFEKSFLNYVHFDRDQQLSAAPRTCHRREMELWDERLKTPSEPLCTLYLKISLKIKNNNKVPSGSFDYLLRRPSAFSVSSSRAVFTDRLLGDRSLSATWPVILGSVGTGQAETIKSNFVSV